jgi:hypothetical protein
VFFFHCAHDNMFISSSITQIIFRFSPICCTLKRKQNGICQRLRTQCCSHTENVLFICWLASGRHSSGRTHTSLLALRRRSPKGAPLFALQNHKVGGPRMREVMKKTQNGKPTTNCIFNFIF